MTTAEAICYQSDIRPDLAMEAMEERQDREKDELQDQLRDLAEEQGLDLDGATGEEDDEMGGFSLEESNDPSDPEGMKLELKFGSETVEMNDELRALIDSILQDLGEIPEEYMDVEPKEGESDAEGGEPPELDDPEPAAKE